MAKYAGEGQRAKFAGEGYPEPGPKLEDADIESELCRWKPSSRGCNLG